MGAAEFHPVVIPGGRRGCEQQLPVQCYLVLFLLIHVGRRISCRCRTSNTGFTQAQNGEGNKGNLSLLETNH